MRNHIWVLNGIICDILSSKKTLPIDIGIYDYRQCFDSLWLQECMNDIYKGGIQDDKFALLFNINTHVNMAVKTPVGKTKRGVITNSIIQGDVFGPMMCGKQVDEIGQECLLQGKYTYKYKGEVDIPPLAMLDDLISISECGHKTAMAHSYIKFKTSSKKLQFGSQKCKKMHIGKTKDEYKCNPLLVDNWMEVIEECEAGKIRIEDICDGEQIMEEKDDERYLGDIISKDGRNIKNIQARVNKGTGIVKNILTYLDGIPFGKFHFEAGILLRNSLLVSSMLFNSEAWYNVTDSELNLLETVDLMLLRGILKAPKSTPKEMMFLELGLLPFREIIRKRRLSFLSYILKEKKDSMLYKFFECQKSNKTKKDWVTTISKDMEVLNIDMTFEDIRNMKKTMFVNMVKRKIEYKTLMDYSKIKEGHSKVKNLKHTTLKLQKYLNKNANLKKDECQMIFKLRSGVTDVKVNQKWKYESYECDGCEKYEETQEHVLHCEEIRKMQTNNIENIEILYEKVMNGKLEDHVETIQEENGHFFKNKKKYKTMLFAQ